MKMTEKQVIEFEKKNKKSYKKPKEWTDAEDIINSDFSKQLNLHNVSKSFYCDSEIIKGTKCKEQCSPCWYKGK